MDGAGVGGAIGRLIGGTSYARERKEVDLVATTQDATELVERIDWADLREGVLHETKKSRATMEILLHTAPH